MELRSIEIPDYIKKVVLSNKRRAKYYKKGDKIPKKYLKCRYDNKGRLIDGNKMPVVKNVRSVGTPKYLTINGQELYSGNTAPFVRAVMVRQIKEFFAEYLKNVVPIEADNFPIRLVIHLYDYPKDGNWDLDNKWIYIKCLMDALKDASIIPDDCVKYVTGSPGFIYHPIQDGATPKMVVKIFTDKRKELIKSQLYNELYSKSEQW